MTLDEYKKQIEAKKQAQQEKLPQFNRRTLQVKVKIQKLGKILNKNIERKIQMMNPI